MQKEKQFTGNNLHQGDVQFFQVTELSSDAKKVKKQFIAKSEKSGHAHALCGDYEMYTQDGVEGFYVQVGEEGATLNHTKYENLTPKYWDTNKALPVADHHPTTLEKGTYYIGIQKRKKHFSKVWEKVED